MIDKPSMSSDAQRGALAHMAHVVAAFAYRCHRMEAIQSEHKAGPLTDPKVAPTVGLETQRHAACKTVGCCRRQDRATLKSLLATNSLKSPGACGRSAPESLCGRMKLHHPPVASWSFFFKPHHFATRHNGRHLRNQLPSAGRNRNHRPGGKPPAASSSHWSRLS